MYTHNLESVQKEGRPLEETGKALLMLHGRGASAADILGLKQVLPLKDFTLFAPEASRNSWYPNSFMAPVDQNQPALDSALEMINKVVDEIMEQGVESHNIYFLGFSQGACLTLEYCTRHARRWGGIVAFTGGLIGETINTSNYSGSFGPFDPTPILITTGDPDPHVPVLRVEASQKILENMGAQVTVKIYKGRPHTILQEEISLAQNILLAK